LKERTSARVFLATRSERGRWTLAGDTRAAADCERLMAAITV
jgi:hypothetical protein